MPEWQSQPRITPTTIIDHSVVGSAEGAYVMFRDRSVLESHFIVDLDGDIWQLMDTDREADANLHANSYAISIETADNGHPDEFPWTPEQIDSLIWLHEALIAAHPTIPRRKSRSCDDPGGLGYHTLHGAPSCWTPVSKTCPGRARKVQWSTTLLPAFVNPPEEDPDMAFDAAQAKLLADTAAAVSRIEAVLFTGHDIANIPIDNLYREMHEVRDAMIVPGTVSAEQAFNILFARVRTIEDTTQETVATVEGIKARVDEIAVEMGLPAAPAGQ